MSIPSSIMANSLGRSSTERTPGSTRGSLKTPASSRLYHNTYPSRSQVRIFSRSWRREANTNRWPLSGSWLTTALTRSANRSNPQRISVASTASQMRVVCNPSSVRRLGKPIMAASPAPLTTHAGGSRQTRPRPLNCVRPQVALLSHSVLAPLYRPPPPALPSAAQTLRSPCYPRIAVSKNIVWNALYRAHDKTPPPSCRSALAQRPAHAISPLLPLHELSSLESDTSNLE